MSPELPGRARDPGRAQAVRGERPRLGLAAAAVVLFLIGAAVISAIVLFQQRTALVERSLQAQRADRAWVLQTAARVGTWAEGQRQLLARLAGMARQELEVEGHTLAEVEARLQASGLPGELRLLPASTDVEGPGADLSFAEREMIQHLGRGEPLSQPQILRPGTATARLVLLSAVGGADGPRAFLLWRRPPDALQRLLPERAPGPLGGAIALRQTAGGGRVSLVTRTEPPPGPAPFTSAVPGTLWELAYWPAELPPVRAWGRVLVLLSAGLLAWLIAVGVVMAWLRRAWRRDQATLIGAMRDALHGRLQARYPLRLRESAHAIESLRVLIERSGQGELQPARETPAVDNDFERLAERLEVEDEPLEIEPADDRIEHDWAGAGPSHNPHQMEVSEVSLDPAIFRAYDVRGIVGQSLTPDVVYQLGRAIGSEARARGEHSIAVGRDGRLSGPELGQALTEGLMATGQTVLDIGMAPTPVLYFAAKYLDTSSGVMVTGSHNPPDYNGFKIVLAEETLSGEAIQALRGRIEGHDLVSGDGKLQKVDVLADYIERIASDVRPERALKVVVDCGNGVAGEAAPRLLEALGCEVVPLYCEIDGHFPNHHPDPSRPENLKDLIETVRSEGADLGLGFDGDGDRVGVIDSAGQIIWPDRLMMLFAADILARHPGGHIIYDVKCSRHLRERIEAAGGVAEMWKTGHSLIKRRMRETGALLAGEMSGHIFFAERWYGFDDALYSAARLLEILARDARPSHEVFAALPEGFSTPELNVSMAEGEPHPFVERLAESADFSGAEVATIDGLRVDYPDGWGLVRASNTTPCLVLRFEADTPQALSRIQAKFRNEILDLNPELRLPF